MGVLLLIARLVMMHVFVMTMINDVSLKVQCASTENIEISRKKFPRASPCILRHADKEPRYSTSVTPQSDPSPPKKVRPIPLMTSAILSQYCWNSDHSNQEHR